MMRTPRVLLDASNLHNGGAVQVAASFLNELFRRQPDELPPWWSASVIWVSNEVFLNLAVECRERVTVVNSVPGCGFLFPRTREFDVAFTIFAPSYRRRLAPIEIGGFADPTVSIALYRGRSIRAWVKRAVKRSRVRSLDHVIVETEVMAASIRRFGTKANQISVVPNAPSRVVLERSGSGAVDVERDGSDLLLFYPARPYPHKNHEFLGAVAHEMSERVGLRVKFVVTITPEELAEFSSRTRESCVPIGVLPTRHLAAIYEAVDGVFFPSLLEVFSATPLEAMALGIPLFASDRTFVREFAQDAAGYFDPENPASAVDEMLRAYGDPGLLLMRAVSGLSIVAEMPSARERADRYLEIVDQHVVCGST